jgi:hypothetical protein
MEMHKICIKAYSSSDQFSNVSNSQLMSWSILGMVTTTRSKVRFLKESEKTANNSTIWSNSVKTPKKKIFT